MKENDPKNKQDTIELKKEEPVTEDVEEKSPSIKPADVNDAKKKAATVVNEQEQDEVINK